MVQAYWLIGKRIVLEEQNGKERAGYGEALLKTLSRKLTSDFGNGFSYANLRNMRQFYLTYADNQICYTLCSKLSWSHNRLIMRVADKDAREFYLKEAIFQQWSVHQTEREIQSFTYQRLLEKNYKFRGSTWQRQQATCAWATLTFSCFRKILNYYFKIMFTGTKF